MVSPINSSLKNGLFSAILTSATGQTAKAGLKKAAASNALIGPVVSVQAHAGSALNALDVFWSPCNDPNNAGTNAFQIIIVDQSLTGPGTLFPTDSILVSNFNSNVAHPAATWVNIPVYRDNSNGHIIGQLKPWDANDATTAPTQYAINPDPDGGLPSTGYSVTVPDLTAGGKIVLMKAQDGLGNYTDINYVSGGSSNSVAENVIVNGTSGTPPQQQPATIPAFLNMAWDPTNHQLGVFAGMPDTVSATTVKWLVAVATGSLVQKAEQKIQGTSTPALVYDTLSNDYSALMLWNVSTDTTLFKGGKIDTSYFSHADLVNISADTGWVYAFTLTQNGTGYSPAIWDSTYISKPVVTSSTTPELFRISSATATGKPVYSRRATDQYLEMWLPKTYNTPIKLTFLYVVPGSFPALPAKTPGSTIVVNPNMDAAPADPRSKNLTNVKRASVYFDASRFAVGMYLYQVNDSTAHHKIVVAP